MVGRQESVKAKSHRRREGLRLRRRQIDIKAGPGDFFLKGDQTESACMCVNASGLWFMTEEASHITQRRNALSFGALLQLQCNYSNYIFLSYQHHSLESIHIS